MGETEFLRISRVLMGALREAYGLAQAGEYGEPLREVLHFARDLVALADEALAADPPGRRTCARHGDAHGRAARSLGGDLLGIRPDGHCPLPATQKAVTSL